MSDDPDWYVKAKAEGRILSETRMHVPMHAPVEPPVKEVTKTSPKQPGATIPNNSDREKAFGYIAMFDIAPTTNNIYVNSARRGRVKSQEYKDWLKKVLPLLEAMPQPPRYPVEVMILIVPGHDWSSNSDVANREKATTDALVAAGVLKGDTSKYVCGVRIGLAPLMNLPNTMCQVWLEERKEWWNVRA